MTEKRESIDERMERKRSVFSEKVKEFERNEEEFQKRSNTTNPELQGVTMSVELDGNKPSMTSKPSRPVTEKKPKTASTITINVDVSEGIKALKALQREAKETVKLLKEVEELSQPKQGQHLTVRCEADIKKVAKELNRLQREAILRG